MHKTQKKKKEEEFIYHKYRAFNNQTSNEVHGSFTDSLQHSVKRQTASQIPTTPCL